MGLLITEVIMRAPSRLCALFLLPAILCCLCSCRTIPSYPLQASWVQKDAVVASIRLPKKLSAAGYRRIARNESMRFFLSPSPSRHPVYEVSCEFFLSPKSSGTAERIARVRVSTPVAGCEDARQLRLSLKSTTYIY
jgi:hypothetical protein|tara:strand:+ start:3348 stop:3758 length:411 start_codon:yes stop_codon:yes gene_type:complete